MGAPAPENHDSETGLLTAQGLDRVLDSELSRAARHEQPLSLVFLEISARTRAHVSEQHVGPIARAAAAAVRERIRNEDSAARVGQLRFAVLAVETGESGTLAAGLTEHVRAALRDLGVEGNSLSVRAGGVDLQYDELSRQELLREAERALSAAGMTGGDVAFPSPRRSSAASINGPKAAS
jgi:GGDEF domain-containing protein